MFSFFFDMLTRVRNALLVKSRTVSVIRTKVNSEIAGILKKEGFIESFEEHGDVYFTEKGPVKQKIRIVLKYKGEKQKSYITNLKRISKPGLRVYVNCSNIPKVLGGVGVAVFAL
jgi:small subunit ribosomal protein S8